MLTYKMVFIKCLLPLILTTGYREKLSAHTNMLGNDQLKADLKVNKLIGSREAAQNDMDIVEIRKIDPSKIPNKNINQHTSLTEDSILEIRKIPYKNIEHYANPTRTPENSKNNKNGNIADEMVDLTFQGFKQPQVPPKKRKMKNDIVYNSKRICTTTHFSGEIENRTVDADDGNNLLNGRKSAFVRYVRLPVENIKDNINKRNTNLDNPKHEDTSTTTHNIESPRLNCNNMIDTDNIKTYKTDNGCSTLSISKTIKKDSLKNAGTKKKDINFNQLKNCQNTANKKTLNTNKINRTDLIKNIESSSIIRNSQHCKYNNSNVGNNSLLTKKPEKINSLRKHPLPNLNNNKSIYFKPKNCEGTIKINKKNFLNNDLKLITNKKTIYDELSNDSLIYNEIQSITINNQNKQNNHLFESINLLNEDRNGIQEISTSSSNYQISLNPGLNNKKNNKYVFKKAALNENYEILNHYKRAEYYIGKYPLLFYVSRLFINDLELTTNFEINLNELNAKKQLIHAMSPVFLKFITFNNFLSVYEDLSRIENFLNNEHKKFLCSASESFEYGLHKWYQYQKQMYISSLSIR